MADYIRRDDAMFALRKAERGGSMTALTRLERAYAEIREMPAADVAEVEHGKPITKIRTVMLTGYHEEIGVFAADGSNLYRKKMAQADIPYDHCPVCGAVLCSRWHNFCGKCGAKMDGGQQHE
mgnify:CR=1 FL=1